METADEIKKEIQAMAQSIFDKEFKPQIIKEMRRLKIKSIKSSMGVMFFTTNNGKMLSDNEFRESSEGRNEFFESYINVWSETPYYQLIDTDIEL